jgi:hypothetical protein
MFGKHFFTLLLTVCFCVLARPAAAGTITVAWDLMTDPEVTGYRVYVGTSPGNYSQTFDVSADEDFFIFKSAFMGVRYYFAVAAEFEDSRFGARSVEVTAVGTRTVSGGDSPGRVRAGDSARPSDCGVDCYVVDEIARDRGEISALAVAPDGTIYAVENRRRVTVFRSGIATTAFEAEPGTTLHDLALDPRFDATGRVFVSLARSHDSATSAVEVLRLRDVGGRLGEPATIFAGVSVPLSADTTLAAGSDGLVYLALPALLSRHPYSAAVLAFDQDGRAAAGLGSIVIARGFEHPVDTGWDPQTQSAWLLGSNAGAETQLLPVSTRGLGTALSNVVGEGEEAGGLAVAPGTSRRLLLAAGVDLIEVTPGASDSLRVSLEGYGVPVAVTAASGVRYVATRSDDASGTFRIVRVEAGGGSAR